MSDAEFPIWKATVDGKDLDPDTEYKFLILDHNGEVVAWELSLIHI